MAEIFGQGILLEWHLIIFSSLFVTDAGSHWSVYSDNGGWLRSRIVNTGNPGLKC